MKFSFSKKEIKDLFISTIALTIAFSILFNRNNQVSILKNAEVLRNLHWVFLIVVLTFVIHELSHKYFANKFKYKAEFRANKPMLVLAIVMSFFGFIFAAPGAVVFEGNANKRKTGIIALAGPTSNLIFAIIGLILAFLTNLFIFEMLFFVNAAIGFFNLLPFPGFDGNKVIKWSPKIFGVFLVISLIIYNLPIIITFLV